MGLNLEYPIPTARMGALLTAHGIQNSAIIEFGPIGTANYYDISARNYGIPPPEIHIAVHTTDMDLALGRYEQLLEAIQIVEKEKKPDVIFLFVSSILNVIGVDAEGILREAAEQVQAPVIVFPCASFDASAGEGMTFMMQKLMEFVPKKEQPKDRTYGLLGCLPDDFHFQSNIREIKRMMSEYFEVTCSCTFPYTTSIAEIGELSRCAVNLVLRKEALPAAEILKQEHGIPYVMTCTCGVKQTLPMLHEISDITGWPLTESALLRDISRETYILDRYRHAMIAEHSDDAERMILLSGNSDIISAIAAFFQQELKMLPCERKMEGKSNAESCEQWRTLIEAHPNAVVFSDGEDKRRYGNRVAVISHPVISYQDLTEDRPFIGMRGGLQVLQLYDDCRCKE